MSVHTNRSKRVGIIVIKIEEQKPTAETVK